MSVRGSSGFTARQAASKSKPASPAASTSAMVSVPSSPSPSTSTRCSRPSTACRRSRKALSVTAIRAPASASWYWIWSAVYVL